MRKIIPLFVILLGCASRPEPPPLSTVDKVLQAAEQEFGAFNEVSFNKDSTGSVHRYNGRAFAITKKLKGLIDKTTNTVGQEYKSKYGADVGTLGEWVWESPTEKITMKGRAMPRPDTTSFVIVWIDRK